MLQAESLLCHTFCEKITQKVRQPLRGRSSQLKLMLAGRLRRPKREIMKILSWNCNMAFRKKADIIDAYKPDIAIIPECECKDVFEGNKVDLGNSKFIWHGKNKNKGLGVFSFGEYSIEVLDHNEEFEYIIPINVKHNTESFILLAIWTQFVNKNIYDSYVVQAARAFKQYSKYLEDPNVIIVGDFNSNSIWDYESKKEYNHSDMVKILKEYNIYSIYHELNSKNHGVEEDATLYMQRKKEKPYHIDYCFCKKDHIHNVKEFRIGKYDDYIGKSDHMPLFIEIEENRNS